METKTYTDDRGREIEVRVSIEEGAIGGSEWTPRLLVRLDEDGHAYVEAGSEHSSERGSTLMSVWHGRDRQWERGASQGALVVADPVKIVDLIGRLVPYLIRVREGRKIEWDGSNMVGTYDEDAEDAAEEISRIMDGDGWGVDWTSDEWSAWDAGDWLTEPPEGLTADSTDEEVATSAEALEAEARADRVLISGSMDRAVTYWRDWLRERREEERADA